MENNVNIAHNNFIGVYQAENIVVDRIMKFCKDPAIVKLANPGMILNDSSPHGEIDKSYKDSMDWTLSAERLQETFPEYVHHLFSALSHYQNDFEATDLLYDCGLVEPCNIQHYPPGGGYKAWHFENGSVPAGSLQESRQFVFMTYLNDVTEGGGTEFFYFPESNQKAVKGKTLIWPASWPWTHRGEVSETQEKYIITGWINTFPASDS